MGSNVLLHFFIIGVLLVTGSECQESVALNGPSRPPFLYHPAEELSMDFSDMHPVFLYASSQNDYVHQNLPEHLVPNHQRPSHQRIPNPPRQKFTNMPPPRLQNQRHSKPRTTPTLTYGFQPKPSTRRQVNNQQRQKKPHPDTRKNQENDRFRHQQEPAYQGTVRQENQHQSKYFTESVQVQNNAQHVNQQNTNAVPSHIFQTGLVDYNQPFNYLSHILSPEKHYATQPSPDRPRPNRNNNPGVRSTQGENRKPVLSQNHGNHPSKEEHRQESIRKHVTFEGTSQAFKERFNNHDNDAAISLKTMPNSYSDHSSQAENKNNDERLNLQHNARSMRGENKPQLPPRPSFNNGGIRINTLAGQLPVMHVDSISGINENPAFYLQRHHNNPTGGEQEKKTYILFKAPPLSTTERPSSAPFVVETVQTVHHTSAPFYLNNFAETSVHVPELTYSTPPEPRALPENNVETPAIVLDLVQIPDHATYSPPDKPVLQSIPSAEFRSSTVSKEHEIVESMPPTEIYPTTPMRQYNDVRNGNKDVYSLLPEDNTKYQTKVIAKSLLPEDNTKYQTKVIAKPKIKESKKPSNITVMQPISYSSSVSVVSVKQSIDARQATAKKQKTTLKKALSSKKKVKIPDYEDLYDDYDGGQNVPGQPGIDFPIYKDIPTTSFDCKNAKSPGFYADIEAGCQVFHNCDTGMYKHSFMCPNGTIFHQELFICDWWYNVKCEDSPDSFSLNSGLYVTSNAHDGSRRKA